MLSLFMLVVWNSVACESDITPITGRFGSLRLVIPTSNAAPLSEEGSLDAEFELFAVDELSGVR